MKRKKTKKIKKIKLKKRAYRKKAKVNQSGKNNFEALATGRKSQCSFPPKLVL